MAAAHHHPPEEEEDTMALEQLSSAEELAKVLVEHRRGALEAMRLDDRPRAREHLLHAAAVLRPLRGIPQVDPSLVETARAMAAALTRIVGATADDKVSEALGSLLGVGSKAPERRLDQCRPYSLDEFVAYYGRDDALLFFDRAEPVDGSERVYTKQHLRLIRRAARNSHRLSDDDDDDKTWRPIVPVVQRALRSKKPSSSSSS